MQERASTQLHNPAPATWREATTSGEGGRSGREADGGSNNPRSESRSPWVGEGSTHRPAGRKSGAARPLRSRSGRACRVPANERSAGGRAPGAGSIKARALAAPHSSARLRENPPWCCLPPTRAMSRPPGARLAATLQIMAQRPWRGEHRTCPEGTGPHAGRVLVPGRSA